MTRAVRWSRDTLDDLKQQVAYISADNPKAARRFAVQVGDAAAALGRMATGRYGRVTGTYEKVVPGLPYVIAYVIVTEAGSEMVSILRVIHTSRDWPPEEWPN